MGFEAAGEAESVSQFEAGFWDALSAWTAAGKARPILSAYSGMDFPPGPPLGKRVPVCVAKAFSLRPRPAQSSILRGWRDPLMRRMAG